jgi:hypothetical protein
MNAAIMKARHLTTRTSWLIGLLLTMVLTYQPSAAAPGAASPVFGRWSAPLLMASGAYVPVMAAANESTILVYNQAIVGSSGSTNPSYRMLPVNGSGWSGAASIHFDPGKQFRQATARFDSSQTAHAVWRSSTTVFYAAQSQWADNQFAVVFADEDKIIEDLDMAIGSDNTVHITMALQDEIATDPSISTGVSRARRPAILADGNDLHVTFTRYVANEQQTIYYTRRPAGTGNWTTPVDITGNHPLAVSLAAGVMTSSLAFCQDSLHVFYFGGLQANSNEQIFGQRYQFGVWQSREMITDNSVRRIRPTAVCHNNRLLLAYEQIITPGTNHAIYVVAAYEQVHLPLIIKN